MSRWTDDTIRRGELRLRQPRQGYRFNVDSVILWRFVMDSTAAPPRRVVDLGAGCGVVGLLLARHWPEAWVTLVELQDELLSAAQHNIADNALGGRVAAVGGDLRRVDRWAEPAPELVVCNPPFHRAGSGRVSGRRQVAVARHELMCTLRELVDSAAAGLGPDGAVCLIHAASRLSDVRGELTRAGLQVERVRMVVPFADHPPTRALVRARRGGASARPAERYAPLVVEESPGRYSREMRQILAEPDGEERRTTCRT